MGYSYCAGQSPRFFMPRFFMPRLRAGQSPRLFMPRLRAGQSPRLFMPHFGIPQLRSAYP